MLPSFARILERLAPPKSIDKDIYNKSALTERSTGDRLMVRELLKTYIKGFDEKLGGGIPEGSVILIVGEPGTMKSSVAFSILFGNAVTDELPGLYISLEQSRESLMDHMSNLEMDISVCEDLVNILDLGLIRKNLTMLADQSWMHVFKMYVENLQKSHEFKLLVLDSLPVLELLAEFKAPRADLFHFFEWLRDQGVTTILISEMTQDNPAYAKYDEDFLADGIFHVKMERVDDINIQRRMRCVKLRSANHSMNFFTLLFHDGSFEVTRVIGEQT
jgi:circadian clock protein KaiC